MLELALSVRTLEIEQLELQIAKLKRMQFGRKSEKIDKKLEPHQPLPDHLPREDHIIEPEEQACPACGGNLKPLREDVSEQLEIIESAFKVILHIRRKKACACCDVIVQAAAPSRPIQRSFAGPGLLANIALGKFADHQPLYRQSVIYARKGGGAGSRHTGRWMGACDVLIVPLVEALQRYVLTPGKIHADDTPMPVLSPGNGQTKTGRLWAYVRDDRNAGSSAPAAEWFAYSPNRQGQHPQSHLAGFVGVFQADAFAGFNAIAEVGQERKPAAQ